MTHVLSQNLKCFHSFKVVFYVYVYLSHILFRPGNNKLMTGQRNYILLVETVNIGLILG